MTRVQDAFLTYIDSVYTQEKIKFTVDLQLIIYDLRRTIKYLFLLPFVTWTGYN